MKTPTKEEVLKRKEELETKELSLRGKLVTARRAGDAEAQARIEHELREIGHQIAAVEAECRRLGVS